MAKPLEEVKRLTVGQLAALVHAIGGLVAVRAILNNKDLAKRVAKFISEAMEEAKKDAEDPESVVAEADTLPAETMTVGGITFEILPIHREGEKSVRMLMMIDRAREMKADLGEEDGKFILDHQDEIPKALRGNTYFVFPGWQRPGFDGFADSVNVIFIEWDYTDSCWCKMRASGGLSNDFRVRKMVLRRRPPEQNP
jgi:hypothetical protein